MTEFDDLTAHERELAELLQSRLRAAEQLDFVAGSKLRAARARALDAARPRRRGWLLASGGLTAAAVLAALLVLRWQPAAPGADVEMDVLEVMTDDLDADFYEDLDMYRWLARTDGNA